jgi:hypothetical protein
VEGARSREQGSGEQGAGSGEQRAESGEQRAENKTERLRFVMTNLLLRKIRTICESLRTPVATL